MDAKRLQHWAEVFESKAEEYEFKARMFLQDKAGLDEHSDIVEGFADELRRKAARARALSVSIRKRISN